MRHEFLDFMWRHAAMFNGYKRKMISTQFLSFDAHKQVCAFFLLILWFTVYVSEL